MSQKVVSAASALVKPILDEMGYYLVEATYKKTYSGMVLEFVIDKPEGITIVDCEKVSRAIDKPLDDLDPTNGTPYNLNVSSPGLDRPLKNEYDYERNMGKLIEIKFYSPWQGKKVIQAIFVGYNDEKLKFIYENQEFAFEKKIIATAVPVIEI